ncbi:hypothetical protein BJ170DRAFT_357128 [Xylariales sp. AK1849]|nr:hypothetical protein BJ170DRAFT_357128 [Xylariales sp. AK1849]
MLSILLLGAAGLVAGAPAPAPAAVNFSAVSAAAAPSLTGPPVSLETQTGVYNAAAASSAAVAAVTGVASAIATASVVAQRDLEARGTSIYGSVTSTAKSSVVVPSTCTPVSWTNTNSFTSDTACPTPYEVGTYCGFTNPEDPCAPQPDGYGPATTPDTPEAFLANPLYHVSALTALPAKGYTQTFRDLNASVNANSYMGLYTLTSYDVQGCADHCDSTSLCTGFNIYIERDPGWNPDGCSCTNPRSITNYKCTIWGSGVQASAATNAGQSRDGFQVVMTGSNGYEKTNTTTPATPSGWKNPQNCSGLVHDHPSTCIGEKMFKGVYDPSVCATYATTQNAVNQKAGLLSSLMSFLGYNSNKCNFFNAFMLTENGKASGTYCKLFAQQYKPSAATSVPGWSGGSYWGVESSWSFCSS